MRSLFWLAALGLMACSGSDDGNSGDDTGTGPTDPFYDYINMPASVTAQGDFSCFTPSANPDEITWLTQTVDPAKQTVTTINGHAEDFESDSAVADATVALWYADQVDGQPDVTTDSDQNGDLTIDAPICEPHTYRVTTDPVLDETKTTFKAHSIYGPDDGNGVDGVFTSVSKVTYQLIPTIVGVAVDPENAIIAGTAFDCTRAADTDPSVDDGKVEGVQVVVRDEDGNIPETLAVKYFTEGFPDRDQPNTSADGLWVAANVPAGRLTVEMWGRIDGDPVLLGKTVVDSEADSINIANVFAGYEDGVKYPDSCVVE